MKPEAERDVADAIEAARRAGVPEREIDRRVRRLLALGGDDNAFLPTALAGTLRTMAREARESAET